MSVLRASQCTATSSRSGQRCRRWATLGTTVCMKHGGAAPQVKAAAARRVTLAEAMASGDRRHPLEVLADGLHRADMLGQHTQELIARGETVTPEMIEALLDSIKTQATMAKLVLDAGGEQWSAREAVRAQGAALARIVKEVARELGHDPDGPEVTAAFAAAVEVVVHGKRRLRAVEPRPLAVPTVEGQT